MATRGYFRSATNGLEIIHLGNAIHTSQPTQNPTSADLWWVYLLTTTLETAGPLWIKLGQWASTRSDVIPDSICKVLGRLRSEVKAHSVEETKRRVQKEMGRCSVSGRVEGLHGIEDVFDEFDFEPVGVGAVAQVYRARLKPQFVTNELSGHTEVAVKVLHPKIEQIIEMDLILLTFFGNLAAWFIPGSKYLAVTEEIQTFSNFMRLQTDLRVEALNLIRFQKNFATAHDLPVSFPTPITSLVSQGLLVETYHDGVLFNMLLDHSPTPFDEELARTGMRAFLRMTMRHNFIHADLHAGNVLVTFQRPSTASSGSFFSRMFQGNKSNSSKPVMETIDSETLAKIRDYAQSSPEKLTKLLEALDRKGYHPHLIILDAGLASTLSPQNSQNLNDVCNAALDFNPDRMVDLLASRCRDPSRVIGLHAARDKMRRLLKSLIVPEGVDGDGNIAEGLDFGGGSVDVGKGKGDGDGDGGNGIKDRAVDDDGLKAKGGARGLLEAGAVLPLKRLRSAQIVANAADLFREHRISLDGEWVALFVAAALVEGVGRRIGGELDLLEVLAEELVI
ncbi:hypothetical protein HDU76_013365 [Blyttiomyces sp. JEL0837]|nr:hypothetical protein HDU76_013365 [Blyttiomyces sp. JEL0837]